MQVYIDYPARMERIRKQMDEDGVDILLATREKSVCYISGAFVPWRSYALAAFGHGIGIVGHEWYPAITSGEEFAHLVFEPDMAEVAALVINKPGVGGMRLECPVLITDDGAEVLTKTQIETTVIDI